MNAAEMWAAAGQTGEYDAWQFGDDADALAALVLNGKKTATSSALCMYEADEPLPNENEYSVILDSRDNAVCIIRTTRVYTTSFRDVTPEHAFKEGEGDRSLEYWRKVHRRFFTDELRTAGLEFDEGMAVVCEEFEVVFQA